MSTEQQKTEQAQAAPLPELPSDALARDIKDAIQELGGGKFPDLIAAVDSLAALSQGWVSVDEVLPEHNQSVALINVNRWENTGGDLEMNVRACGYLNACGGVPYWSIRGERATSIEAFTHWMPLPAAPKAADGSDAA